MNLARSIRRNFSPVDPDKRRAFDALWQRALAGGPNAFIDYDLPYNKCEFLNYLCDELGLYVHGSNEKALSALEPIRRSSDFSEFGSREQVFATCDGLWAMWFAVLDKEKSGGTTNGCLTLEQDNGTKERAYYFAVAAEALKKSKPFVSGAIYIVPAASFPHGHELPFGSPAPYVGS